MIHLTEPDRQYLPSYQEAYDEYARHAVSTYSFGDADAQDLLEKYRRYAIAQDLPPNHVGADYYLSLIHIYKVYLMQNELNLRYSEVISTYVYKVGLASPTSDFSYSTAIGLFNSAVNLLLLVMVNAVSRRMGETSLW